jgi:lambda family phage portal protein
LSRKVAKSLPLESIRTDYDIAKRHSRFRRQRDGVSTVATTGDYHYRSEADFLYSIELGRDLDRNDPVAGMILDRLIDNILDERGMSPDPDTGDENLDMAIKRRWDKWAQHEDECDLAGEMTFDQMERMVLRSAFVDGDIFALPNVSGAIELLEAHRCRTPRNTTRNVVHGVLLDESRKRLEYWFTKDEIDPLRAFAKVSDTVAVPARNADGIKQVFHVYDPNRVSQTRGVSVFRRNADMLGMHDDIEFANLVRQQVASCFVMIETDDNEVGSALQQIGGQQSEKDGTDSGANSKPADRTVEGIAPGMRYSPGAGKKVEGFTPDIPGPQFFEHVMLVLKIVSANLNLPVFAVLLDASETNFSGWRGAMDQARNAFRRIQNWLIDKFHRKVYEWKIRQWLAEDPEIRAWADQDGVDVFRHTWKRPRWEYIQPVQDVAADVSKVSSLISSLRQVHARRGDDFDEVIPEIIADNKDIIRQAIEAARDLNQSAEDDTERITWREMLAIPMPEGSLALLTAERARLSGGEADV